MLGDVDPGTGEAYFLVTGRPNVTIQFPWTEVVIMVIMILIILRLMVKKETKEMKV